MAEHYKEQFEFEFSDTFKERIKRRPIIEHKKAEMKRFHGMDTASYHGLFRMWVQAYLTAFDVNVKRMVKLKEQKQPISSGEDEAAFSIASYLFSVLSPNYHLSEAFAGLSLLSGFLFYLMDVNLKKSRMCVRASCTITE